MDNWIEYALGGTPTNTDANTVLPTFGIGGDWMEYAYRSRTDYMVRGLDYTVEATTNLVSNDWNANGVVDSGSGPLDVEFDFVTNRVSTAGKDEQFIRLIVK